MNQTYTLHTHTIGFDGKNSVQDMVSAARDTGFTTIGFSNHFIVHPKIKQTKMYKYSVRGGYNNIYSSDFDEAVSKFISHYDELYKLQNGDMKILTGMEVDFFDSPQWLHGFEKCVSVLNPDYIIGACHFIEYNNTLLNSHDWKNADYDTQNILIKMYWDKITRATSSGLFTWMAHLDLPKKANIGRDDKWIPYETNAIDAISKSGTAIEINTGYYRSYCYEPYPSPRILQMAKEKNIPVLISDDAHAASQIGRHFDEAEMLIKQFNLQKFSQIK
jgi:histidinol-phosphatase (PHP family)